jgi:hypothetical protein
VGEGTGNFRALPGATPFVGETGQRHYEAEARLEVIYPSEIENELVAALKSAHPYEEVAYDLVALQNSDRESALAWWVNYQTKWTKSLCLAY